MMKNMSRILKLYLEREGYTVQTVFNGEDALDYFETDGADLMILDWMMPGRDGLSVCREIRPYENSGEDHHAHRKVSSGQ